MLLVVIMMFLIYFHQLQWDSFKCENYHHKMFFWFLILMFGIARFIYFVMENFTFDSFVKKIIFNIKM
jgi:hypothetical protein